MWKWQDRRTENIECGQLKPIWTPPSGALLQSQNLPSIWGTQQKGTCLFIGGSQTLVVCPCSCVSLSRYLIQAKANHWTNSAFLIMIWKQLQSPIFWEINSIGGNPSINKLFKILYSLTLNAQSLGISIQRKEHHYNIDYVISNKGIVLLLWKPNQRV